MTRGWGEEESLGSGVSPFGSLLEPLAWDASGLDVVGVFDVFAIATAEGWDVEIVLSIVAFPGSLTGSLDTCPATLASLRFLIGSTGSGRPAEDGIVEPDGVS